jgi:hypothetical protein
MCFSKPKIPPPITPAKRTEVDQEDAVRNRLRGRKGAESNIVAPLGISDFGAYAVKRALSGAQPAAGALGRSQ